MVYEIVLCLKLSDSFTEPANTQSIECFELGNPGTMGFKVINQPSVLLHLTMDNNIVYKFGQGVYQWVPSDPLK